AKPRPSPRHAIPSLPIVSHGDRGAFAPPDAVGRPPTELLEFGSSCLATIPNSPGFSRLVSPGYSYTDRYTLPNTWASPRHWIWPTVPTPFSDRGAPVPRGKRVKLCRRRWTPERSHTRQHGGGTGTAFGSSGCSRRPGIPAPSVRWRWPAAWG